MQALLDEIVEHKVKYLDCPVKPKHHIFFASKPVNQHDFDNLVCTRLSHQPVFSRPIRWA